MVGIGHVLGLELRMKALFLGIVRGIIWFSDRAGWPRGRSSSPSRGRILSSPHADHFLETTHNCGGKMGRA
jgi:hypothetical protein